MTSEELDRIKANSRAHAANAEQAIGILRNPFDPGWEQALQILKISIANMASASERLAVLEPVVQASPDASRAVQIYYMNWRKQSSLRTITPLWIWWGTNEWHQTPQHFLHAWDHGKNAVRDFALLDIQSVMNAEFEDGKLITGAED